MNKEEILDKIHLNIHALRLIPNYKPTEFERRINSLIIAEYKDKCDECKSRETQLSQAPQNKSKFWEEFLHG